MVTKICLLLAILNKHIFLHFIVIEYSARGDYYLQTNGMRPFSRGIEGLRYKEMEYDLNHLFVGEKTIRKKPIRII